LQTLTLLAWITLGLVVQGPGSVPAGEKNSKPKSQISELEQRARDEKPRALERQSRIKAELQTAGLPAWAGTFVSSRGYHTIDVAPKSGLVSMTSIDVVGTDRWNHGSIVRYSERRFEVEFALPFEAPRRWYLGRTIPSVSSAFFLVAYSGRDFLVPEEQMIELCNTFNCNTDRMRCRIELDVKFPSRDNGCGMDDPTGPVRRPSDIPEPYRKYLLEHEVTARVTAVGDSHEFGKYAGGEIEYETSVTVDVGLDRKLQQGMVLFLSKPNHLGPGELVEVGESSSRVVFRHSHHDPSGEWHIAKDDSLSSLRPDRKRLP
jgi:hypothetical protein